MHDIVVPALINGVVYGLLIFMLASGLTLVFSLMGVLNFAHAAFYMVGAYLAYTVSRLVGFWWALFSVPLAVMMIGIPLEYWGLRLVRKAGHVAELLLTFGVSIILQELVQMIWGRLPVPYHFPSELIRPVFLLSAQYPAHRIFTMVLSAITFGSIFVVFRYTRVGLIVQAALTYPEIVNALGHNVPRIFSVVFGAGCGLAGLAGVVGGAALSTDPEMAYALGGIVFVVVVVGGLGSVAGAFVASLAIGICQTLFVVLDLSVGGLLGVDASKVAPGTFQAELLTLSLSRLSSLFPYLLMLIMLIVRPRGLWGKRDI